MSSCTCDFNGNAGGHAGLDANVLSAYCNYAEEMEDLNASITSVYWCMFHKSPPDRRVVVGLTT
jgi:hypothetical protein